MKHVLQAAKQEIIDLRRRNEVLQAQADVVAAFSAALFGPPRQMGASVDVAWQLEKIINDMNAASQTQPGPDTPAFAQ